MTHQICREMHQVECCASTSKYVFSQLFGMILGVARLDAAMARFASSAALTYHWSVSQAPLRRCPAARGDGVRMGPILQRALMAFQGRRRTRCVAVHRSRPR